MENHRDMKGRFVKGHLGFKPRGSGKKKKIHSMDKVAHLLDLLDEKIMSEIDQLSPNEKVKFWVQLHKMIHPKSRPVDFEPKEEPISKIIFEVRRSPNDFPPDTGQTGLNENNILNNANPGNN